MSEPWFDAMLWAWLPGTLLGCLGGLWGALAGSLAPAGRGRGLILGSGLLIVGTCLVLLVLGVTALMKGQPYGVWYGLGFPGLLGIILFASLLPVVLKRYGEAEQRKIQAEDFR